MKVMIFDQKFCQAGSFLELMVTIISLYFFMQIAYESVKNNSSAVLCTFIGSSKAETEDC